ncbi:GAF domain-containing protein [Thermocoleostomius sinensis]|jgi:GAF domain-containing protein|nr:GAF domain-containing protein [Thermocoleostomius sinensis]
MSSMTLPPVLEQSFAHSNPEAIFVALLPAVCEVLQTDRCFLEVRNPQTRLHRNICWRRSPDLPDTSTEGWQPEQEWEQEDPMFAAALRTAPSIYVEDVETAAPEVLNLEFERKYFGHRALIHAHICHEQQLWGILQPCMFGQPRVWSEFDRAIIEQLTDKLAPIVVHYVRTTSPN